MVQVDGTEILTYGAPWGDSAQAALAQDENGCTLTVIFPGFGEAVVCAGAGGLSAHETLDDDKIEETCGGDLDRWKEFRWQVAEALTDALSWAREMCPLLPEVTLGDWRETDYGWRAERNGVMLRLDHDGLVAVADDPFGR